MTVSQFCEMLNSLNLGEYSNVFKKEDVDGPMLHFLNLEGLAQLGVTNPLHACRILGHVAKLKQA